MGSTFGSIELGKRSMMAHNQSITTAGHNIANADTKGFSRQRVNNVATDPLYRPDLSREETPGQIGQGVNIQSITRLRDELIDARIVTQSNQESYWTTREKYYMMIENVYNEPDDVSIRSNMDKFWESWQELSVYPDSKAARQAIVTRSDTLMDAITTRFDSLSGIGDLLNGDIEATVKQVNSLTDQIGEINKEIVRVKAMGDNPNDLMDRRDLLVEDLSKLVNITSDRRDADEYMIHIDGKILVQGGAVRNLNLVTDLNNNGYTKVIWGDTGDKAVISGGTLGALIELRDVDIRSEIQNLNTMTLNFADLVNDAHRGGVGINGVTGIDFFVEHPAVANVVGNYDRDGDGVEDSSYIFRMTGANALQSEQQTGLEGVLTLSSASGNIEVPYYPTDTVDAIVNRINNSNGEVKAYLDRNNCLVLKGTTAKDNENPDFVIRHVEDSGHFLVGYAGLLNASGADGAYDFNHADAVDALVPNTAEDAVSGRITKGAQFAVSPVTNPSAYIKVNPAIKNDVLSVAAAYPTEDGILNTGDGRVAVEIASIRNTPVMIGVSRTFDDYFADSVTNVGLKGEQAELNMLSQNAILDDLRGIRDSISGVNVSEELADLIKFQHGFNAAAKYITIVDQLLDTVINGII